LDSALKCLYAFGFFYRDTLIPEQNKSGFNSLENSTVFVRGDRGISRKIDVSIKTDSLDDILKCAEQICSSPFLLLGHNISKKDWIC
jgi:hypothetical protein